MNIRAYHQLLAALLVGLFSVTAVAQYSRDASANKKIDEAINNHYLMMQLDKAESLLTGTVSACGDKCSPQTKAKAWMYVGIVRGSGKNDQSGAAEAFATAKGIDPSVKLDEALATPETKTTFEGAAGSASSSEPDPVADPMPMDSGSAPGAAPPPAGVPGDMLCSPQGADIQTNMPIPISCSSDAAVVEGFIKFKEPGGSDWKKIALSEVSGQWQAEIPCKFTTSTGELKFYIGMKDASGEYVDQFGSKKAPASITVSDSGVAPAFPGQPPVQSCVATAGSSDCPPDFPGCESTESTAVCGDLDWGASCGNSSQCKCGLLCEGGQCVTAPTCTADDECDTGSCVDGYCSAVSGGDAPGAFSRHILSFAAGLDLMPVAGVANLCGADEGFGDSYGIQCYDTESNRSFPEGVDVGAGAAPAQLRLKLGYDYAITQHILFGARVGFAFLNSHPSAANEPAFLPLHIEVRGAYNFTSLAKKGLQAGLYLGGGFAESNAKLVVEETEIYKVAGRAFGALGGTLGYAFAPNVAVNLDVQGMFLLPAGGITPVVHPALSFVYGL